MLIPTIIYPLQEFTKLTEFGFDNQWIKCTILVDQKYDFNTNKWLYTYETRMIFAMNWISHFEGEQSKYAVRGLAQKDLIMPFKGPYALQTEWHLNSYELHPKTCIALFTDSIAVPYLYRLNGDHELSFGDGGHSIISIPVWTQHHLPITKQQRLQYLNHFLEINETVRDMQQSTVVYDIIDPNLFPRYFPDMSRAAVMARIHARTHMMLSDYVWKCNHGNRIKDNLDDGLPGLKIPIREQYHWVPSNVHIDALGNAYFLSPIQGLDGIFQTKTITICQEIFTAMVPLFTQAGLLESGRPCDLQVVVKVQRYVLEPLMSYTGKWHVEGLTENIQYGGVYYIDQDPELDGGGLKFRNSGSPDNFYYCQNEIKRRDVVANVASNTAIVFANTVPHRLLTLKNTSVVHSQSRMFINFFVIDPKHPLPSTAEFKSSMGIEKAKRKRQEHRDQMSVPDYKHGFAQISWGNCGTLDFVDHVSRIGLDDDISIYSKSSGQS
jgi:hypothetical protein